MSFEKPPFEQPQNEQKVIKPEAAEVPQNGQGLEKIEKESKIESAKEGVEKSKEIMEDMLSSIPDVDELTDQFSRRMKEGSTTWAWEISGLMSLRAELSGLLYNINTRQRGVRNPDNFSFSLMLPLRDTTERLETYLRFSLGKESYSTAEILRGKLLRNLQKVVDESWEILDKEK